MRIGIDCRNYGGAHGYKGQYLKNLVISLKTLTDGNEYILFFDEKGFHQYDSPSVNIQKVLTHSNPYSVSDQLRFPLELSHAKLDTMLFFHASIPLLFFGHSFLSIADLSDFFYPSKDMKAWWRKYFRHFLLKQSVHRAKGIIVQGETTKRDIVEVFNISEERISVIPPMVIPMVESALSETEGNTYLMNENISPSYMLFSGELREHKNIPRLLQAYALLSWEQIPDLVLAGQEDPEYHEIRATLIKLGLQTRVHLCNPSEKELRYLLRHALAYIQASLYEGSEQAVIIAMEARLPIVSSILPSMENVLGKDGAVFFRAMSTEDMRASLQKIIYDQDLREQLAKKTYDMSVFSAHSVTSKIIALLSWKDDGIVTKKGRKTTKSTNI